MKNVLYLLLTTTIVWLTSCSENGTANQTTTVDSAASVSAPKKKGRIWDKVNIVQIPLTAKENNIHGKVKSVRYVDYKFVEKDGQYEKVLEDSGYNVYDSYGHLIDQNEYDAKGKPKWQCTYRYDSNDRAIEWIFRFPYRNDEETTIFKYDEKGNKTEAITTTKNPANSSRALYTYDAAGNEIEVRTFKANETTPSSIEASKYDASGNQVELAYSMRPIMLNRKMTAVYDANGNKVSAATYDNDTLQDSATMTLDNKGRTIEIRDSSHTGKSGHTTKIKYDDWDNITEYMWYKADGTTDTSGWNSVAEYEYDSQGNKTRETNYKIKQNKRIPDNYTEAIYSYH